MAGDQFSEREALIRLVIEEKELLFGQDETSTDWRPDRSERNVRYGVKDEEGNFRPPSIKNMKLFLRHGAELFNMRMFDWRDSIAWGFLYYH